MIFLSDESDIVSENTVDINTDRRGSTR